jgi:hypothetical protein
MEKIVAAILGKMTSLIIRIEKTDGIAKYKADLILRFPNL